MTQQNFNEYQPLKIQGNLDSFQGQNVITISRGVHFLEEIFTKQQAEAFLHENHVNQPMFCSAAFAQAGKDYGVVADYNEMEEHAKSIANRINGLDSSGPYENFESQRYAFQQLYSNNSDGFYNQLSKPSGFYGKIFKKLSFERNPLISFSSQFKHPFKYAGGAKNFGKNKALRPNYDLTGKPKNPSLGKFYAVVLDEAAVEELKPLNVSEAHWKNKLKISTHFRNDILSENEVSIAGFVPAEYVVFEMPFTVPSFDGPYHTGLLLKYGLSQTCFNNLKKIFTNPATPLEKRVKKELELINGIIEAPRQDSKLNYKNCFAESVKTLFDKEFKRIDAQNSKLTLEYKLEKAT